MEGLAGAPVTYQVMDPAGQPADGGQGRAEQFGGLQPGVHAAGQQQPGLCVDPVCGAERGQQLQQQLLSLVPGAGVPPARVCGDGDATRRRGRTTWATRPRWRRRRSTMRAGRCRGRRRTGRSARRRPTTGRRTGTNLSLASGRRGGLPAAGRHADRHGLQRRRVLPGAAESGDAAADVQTRPPTPAATTTWT